MTAQAYWNTIGVQKEFEDPIYLDKLAPFLTPNAKIIEYGCGYGRLLHFFYSQGYENLVGFDYAPAMIKRGQEAFPNLALHAIETSGKIPVTDQTADLVVLSTILCCILEKEEQKKVIDEMQRVLKRGGVLYLSDFSLCSHPLYQKKYVEGEHEYGEWGIYTTSEGLTVRHHSTEWITDLLSTFDIQWMEQFNFKTMNNNPARTIHCIAQKR